ncbi:MAG TPA: cupin-like domain-containing protein [Acidimicrobiales bacterium]
MTTAAPTPRGTLDNVPRLRAPNPATFEVRHLRRGTPVILTDLFDHAPVRRLADPRVARSVLADVPLVVTPNTWRDLLLGRERAARRRVPFGAFLDELADGRAGDQHCLEQSTPDELLALLPPPAYLRTGSRRDSWESYLFVAGAGNTVHLHYDHDLRHVLMHQVFGRKRYVIIDPAESHKLAPGSRPQVRRTSALFLEHFSGPDLLAFLRYVNAWDCVLEPGETLLIPATCWHYVEYVTDALSVNFCLPRNEHLRRLAEIFPESSVELLALASRFRDPSSLGPEERAAYAALLAADERDHPDDASRLAALDALTVRLAERLGLPVAGPGYHLADLARRARITRRRLVPA